MKRLFIALACIAAITGALADEPAKGKTKKSESQVSKVLDKTGRNIWISPSDKERRAKRKAAKSKDEK